MIKLNDKDKAVYEIIQHLVPIGKSVGPTEVGLKLGYSYDNASSSVMNSFKKLVEHGYLKKDSTERGKYYIEKDKKKGLEILSNIELEQLYLKIKEYNKTSSINLLENLIHQVYSYVDDPKLNILKVKVLVYEEYLKRQNL